MLSANKSPRDEHIQGRYGARYKQNKGVYKIRLQGLQACEFGGVIGEALLVYGSSGSSLQDSEVELANFYEHSSRRPHTSNFYESVSIKHYKMTNSISTLN